MNTFNFGIALTHLKAGRKVARIGWNGKDMFLYLVPESFFNQEDARPPVDSFFPYKASITYRAHIDMKTVDDELVPWLASQSDLLSDDWLVVA